jgi:hypothetical protein
MEKLTSSPPLIPVITLSTSTSTPRTTARRQPSQPPNPLPKLVRPDLRPLPSDLQRHLLHPNRVLDGQFEDGRLCRRDVWELVGALEERWGCRWSRVD